MVACWKDLDGRPLIRMSSLTICFCSGHTGRVSFEWAADEYDYKLGKLCTHENNASLFYTLQALNGLIGDLQCRHVFSLQTLPIEYLLFHQPESRSSSAIKVNKDTGHRCIMIRVVASVYWGEAQPISVCSESKLLGKSSHMAIGNKEERLAYV